MQKFRFIGSKSSFVRLDRPFAVGSYRFLILAGSRIAHGDDFGDRIVDRVVPGIPDSIAVGVGRIHKDHLGLGRCGTRPFKIKVGFRQIV